MENVSEKNIVYDYLIGQEPWPNDLQFKRRIQNCALPCVLTSMVSQFSKLT